MRIFLAILLFSSQVFAAYTAPSLKGQNGTAIVRPNLQFPTSAVADLGGNAAYISTGNNNQLVDPDMQDTATSAYTAGTGTTLSKDATTYISGLKSLKAVFSGTAADDFMIKQSSNLATTLVNQNLEFTVWVKTSNSGISFCALQNNSCSQTVAVTGDGAWHQYTINNVGIAGTQNGFTITKTVATGTTATVNIGLAYMGLTRNISTGIPASTMVARVLSDGTVSVESGGDWINGNCAVTDTSLFTCTLNSGFFTATPTCTTSPIDTTVGISSSINAASSSSVAVRTVTNAATKAAYAFSVTCTKAGADYIQQAITPNLGPQSWSGYHGTDCQWARTNTSFGDPTADVTCTFTERSNQNFGTVTSALSGSDKLPGIVFTPKQTGTYNICVNGLTSHSVGTQALALQLVDGSGTVITTWNTQAISTNDMAFDFCGVATVSSSASQTFKIQTKTASGTIYIGSGNGAESWSIFPISGAYPTPQLLGSITSNAPNAERHERLRFTGGTINQPCTVSPCTIYTQSGSWATSVTRSATGIYSVNYPSGTWSAPPDCVCSGYDNGRICTIQGTSTTAIGIGSHDSAGVASDQPISLLCEGPR